MHELFAKLRDTNITQPSFLGSPLVTGAWQSRLQDCRPLL